MCRGARSSRARFRSGVGITLLTSEEMDMGLDWSEVSLNRSPQNPPTTCWEGERAGFPAGQPRYGARPARTEREARKRFVRRFSIRHLLQGTPRAERRRHNHFTSVHAYPLYNAESPQRF